MLDLFPSAHEGVNDRVPMDLSQYLLSASPPSLRFDFMALSIQSNINNNININNPQHSQNNPASLDNESFHFSTNNCPFHQASSFSHKISDRCELSKRKAGGLKSIIICSESYSSDSEGECSTSPDSRPQSPRRTNKKVSFADHKGLALAHVRLVKEGPDEPPLLSSKVLSMITQGANAGISSNPPIKLCFPQPASDYMAFRDKVIHNLVSLENVILQDYMVKGTIKVKNITFEKRVFVRVTTDDWSSCEDFEASYVPGPGGGYVDANDTFSFCVNISPSFDVTKKIQFAVCFEENGKEHWDNNDGTNYCIVSDGFEPELSQQSTPPHINHRWLPEKNSDTSSWAEFSVWRDVGCSERYY